MTRVFLLSLMILGAQNVTPDSDNRSRNPAEIIREQFFSIDSVTAALSATAVKLTVSRGYVDSIAQSILNNNRVIQGITLFDKSGVVINSYDRSKKTVAVQNVALKEWFVVPSAGQVPFFGGIVQANSKNCLLKSYPLPLNNHKNQSNGVLVVLVDVAQLMEQFEHRFGQPFTLLYKSIQLFSTSAASTDFTDRAMVPGYNNLEIAYGAESASATTTAVGEARTSGSGTLYSTPSPIVYIGIVLFLGLITFACGRYYYKKNIARKILEMEYEKISKEQFKQIHDRALSQVYCEVKRQIETHEMGKIEDEIRHKIENDIRDKVLAS